MNDRSGSARDTGEPDDIVGPPPAISPPAAQTRAIIQALSPLISEAIRSEIREAKKSGTGEFRYLLTVFGAGFLILAGLFISGYLLIDSKIGVLNSLTIRIDQKLEDLLQRLPPAQSAPPRR